MRAIDPFAISGNHPNSRRRVKGELLEVIHAMFTTPPGSIGTPRLRDSYHSPGLSICARRSPRLAILFGRIRHKAYPRFDESHLSYACSFWIVRFGSRPAYEFFSALAQWRAKSIG